MKSILKISLVAIAISSIAYAHGENNHMKGMNMSSMSTGKMEKFNISSSQIKVGKRLFSKSCVTCHGVGAVGGKFKVGVSKPPALNGTKGSHITHHNPQSLMKTIMMGQKGMPSFRGKLKPQEVKAIFAYLHSLWSKKVQKDYDKKFNIKVVK